jgi:thiol-disulfide isomerase/thioredoxin
LLTGLCEMVAPILEQLVGEYGDKLTIAKIKNKN